MKSRKFGLTNTSMSLRSTYHVKSGCRENETHSCESFLISLCVDVTLIVLSEDPEKSKSPVE